MTSRPSLKVACEAVTSLEVDIAYCPNWAVPVESFTVPAPIAMLDDAFATAQTPNATADDAAYEYAPSATPEDAAREYAPNAEP